MEPAIKIAMNLAVYDEDKDFLIDSVMDINENTY